VSRNEMTTVEQDRLHREGVLMFLLDEPCLATIDEVITYRLTFVPAEEQALFRDGTERAIGDLAAAGVVNITGRSVSASRAAREVASLLEGGDTRGSNP